MDKNSLRPGWKTFKFGDIAQNVAVRVDPADAKTEVYVGLEHLDPSTLHLRQWGHPSDVTGQKLAFKKGDVIFGRRRAYQRKLAVAEFDGICSAHAMVVRAKPKMILPEFLPFFLQSDMFMERAIEISVGSLSPTINWKTLRVQEFPLPPLDEQKRIAEILWVADEVVAEWRKVVINATNLIDAYANEVALDAKANGALIDLNKLARGESSSFTNGPFGSNLLTSELTDEGVPVIYVRDVKNGRYIRQENVCVTPAKAEELKACKTVPGDMLFNKVGDPPGIASIYPEGEPDAIVTQDVIRLRVDASKADPEYLKFFFNSKPGRELLNEIIIRGTRQRFSLRDFKKIKIPLPKLSAQIEAAQNLKKIENNLEKSEKHLQETVELQKRLVQEPLRGNYV